MAERKSSTFSFRVTIEDAQERVKKNPESHMNQGLLGELLYQAQRYTEAIDHLQRGAELLQKEIDSGADAPIPGYVASLSQEMATKILHSLHMMRGDSYLRLKKYAEARKAFEQAAKILAEDSDTWNLLGVAQANSGGIEDALKSFRDAVRCNPARPDLWDNLQKAYRQLRRPESEEITPVLMTKRDIELDLALLAELYIGGGDYDKASKVLDQLFGWKKDDIRALIPLAKLKFIEGDMKESIRILEDIVKRDKNNEDALWELSRLYCVEGEKNKSEKNLDALLKLNSGHPNANVLRNYIEKQGAAATQTFGVLNVKDRTTEDEDGKRFQMTEYLMYPVLTLPLGSTIEDVTHALVRGDVSRFTSDEYLKAVSTYTSHTDRGMSITTSGLQTKAWEFKYYEPGSLSGSFMETGPGRGIRPSGHKSEIVVNGDVILLGSEMDMIQRMQVALIYSVVKRQADEKIANWPYRL